MRPRDPREPHRTATPLELFFDLVFVVAIAQAAAGLHHAVSGNHLGDALTSYLLVFFAIWWAWMNFTWFASAYDCDDAPYRLTVFIQLTGALVIAAGVSQAFDHLNFTTATFGYTLMRVGTVTNWFRASFGDPERRVTARRYAWGLIGVQLGWLGLLLVPIEIRLAPILALVAAELMIPAWAERASPTPWHPHHIAERYGLLTIIVLGESVLSATVAIQKAVAEGEGLATLWPTITGGVVLLYSMWWMYFDRPMHDLLTSLRKGFVWGYGHYFVYAAAAAVGAGIAVNADAVTHHAQISGRAAGFAVAVPTAIYLAVLWVLHYRPRAAAGYPNWPAPILVAAVLATPWTPYPLLAAGLLVAGVLALKLFLQARTRA